MKTGDVVMVMRGRNFATATRAKVTKVGRKWVTASDAYGERYARETLRSEHFNGTIELVPLARWVEWVAARQAVTAATLQCAEKGVHVTGRGVDPRDVWERIKDLEPRAEKVDL